MSLTGVDYCQEVNDLEKIVYAKDRRAVVDSLYASGSSTSLSPSNLLEVTSHCCPIDPHA
jgi:hypothetical protein